MGKNLEYIGVLTTILLVGVTVGVTPIHQKLSRMPWVGVLLFMVALLGLYAVWGNLWQFYTLYFVLFILVLEYLFLALSRKNGLQVTVKLNRKLFWICAYVCICGSLLFTPFSKMNIKPVKQYVGTWKIIVESSNRLETMAKVEGLKRRYSVQLYYPIADKSGKEKSWFEGAASVRGMALSYGLPEALVGHLKQVGSGVYLSKKIQVADTPYPVIVISHGLKSSSEQYTRFSKALAEKGYLVAVINHPYSAYSAVFSNRDYILGADSPAAQIDYVDQKIELEKQMTLLQQGDLMETFKVLDELNQGRYAPNFEGVLDLSDITLVGHQIGGGAVVTTLNQVPYVKSAVLFNPVVEQIPKKYILEGSKKPILSLLSKDYLQSNNATYLKRYLQGSEESFTAMILKGTDLDMTDLSRVSYLFSINGLSDGLSANQHLLAAQVALVDQAVQKYSQGQIFEDIAKNLDMAKLGIEVLEPEVID